jgi:hypothetical protein
MIVDRSNHVRPIEAVSTAAEVILKVVVELEGLAILHAQNAVYAPAIFQPPPLTTHFGKLIGEIPSEAPGEVEV